MHPMIEKFGNSIGTMSEKHPIAARRLLLAAFYAKKLQLAGFPNRRLPKSKRALSIAVMNSIIGCLRHPEQSAMVSLFTPCEPLHVLGINPYSVEGLSSYLTGAGSQKRFIEQAVGSGISDTFCSYHKIFIGAAQSGVMPKPRFVIYTNLACDANMLTFRYMADHFGIPKFAIDVPYAQTEEAVGYVAEQLQDMVRFVEECAGQKVPYEDLCQAVKRSQRTFDNFNRFYEMQRERYLAGDVTSELYAAFITHVLLGTNQAEAVSRQYVADMEKAPKARGVKLLWLHTIPYWQQPVLEKLNYNPDMFIGACDMCYEGMVEADPARPFDAMARRLVYSGFNGEGTCRIERAVEMARRIAADGAVYFCHWGCKETLGTAKLAKDMLEQAGIPVLLLDGDGCDPANSSDGQVATRLGAFLEMLEGKKR